MSLITDFPFFTGSKDSRRKGRRINEKTQSQNQAPVESPLETSQNEVAHDLQIALLRRLGSISNELGASALNQAVLLLDNNADGGIKIIAQLF